MIGFPSCLTSVLLYAIYVFSLPNISHRHLVPSSELDPLLVKRHNFKVLSAMSQSNWQSSGQKRWHSESVLCRNQSARHTSFNRRIDIQESVGASPHLSPHDQYLTHFIYPMKQLLSPLLMSRPDYSENVNPQPSRNVDHKSLRSSSQVQAERSWLVR
jgi:hypothetical protein